MLRLKGEGVFQQSQVDVIAPNMFSGSVLDLEPDTAYEAQFAMSDPDGKLYKAEDFDFRLKPGSAVLDRGIPLANETDGFTGKAPDLGALEAGAAVPHYGPRP
jgi:hypothetical protein